MITKKLTLVFAATALLFSCSSPSVESTPSVNDIVFNDLAVTWDEGMPLGNAIIGANVWSKDGNLRMAIDRIDLWDLRPTDSLSGDNFRFKWVEQQWQEGTYGNVQRKMDAPYDQLPAPSKIPGAAIEFDVEGFGEVLENRIFIDDALLEVKWNSGVVLKSFVHATEPVGWFEFSGVGEEFVPQLLSPRYQAAEAAGQTDPVSGQDLRRLEYVQGEIVDDNGFVTYHQKGWNEDYYDVAIRYEYRDGVLRGVWSVSSSISDKKNSTQNEAKAWVESAFQRGMNKDFQSHKAWWGDYWNRSQVSIPNKTIEKQYYNEMYKFGCSTREDSYIIPLQSVWTADNGLLPPWKGDVHHDLNTQLSYWPTYTGNLCDVGMSYLNVLWAQRDVNRAYTKEYFEVDGLNVPGVATLTGEPMGGWIQYSLSPTVSAWLAQHFYLHWAYTMDSEFLRTMGYPYLKEVCEFLENITYVNEEGKRVLPLSSSPEIFDNSPKAWFPTMTNYDLSLIYSAFDMAQKMATADGKADQAEHWGKLRDELPEFALDTNYGLKFSKDIPYNESHRHFSNALAVMPLSIFDVTKSEQSRRVVEGTIEQLDKEGPAWWCGYSYSWIANMKARALDAKGAEDALNTFATCFVLRNGFHCNGDQSGTGKSNFTYRPFTLEGNFAFAAGVQEMLLQSHTDTVRIFPATPVEWNDAEFKTLRARGALLVSAAKKDGKVQTVEITNEKGYPFYFESPFEDETEFSGATNTTKISDKIYKIESPAGAKIQIKEK